MGEHAPERCPTCGHRQQKVGPIPWSIINDGELIEDADGAWVCWGADEKDISPANAELICRAVNSHKDLVIALERLTEWGREHTSPQDKNSPHELLIAAVAALERAKFG